MFRPETCSETYTCPNCGGKLAVERDLFQCKEHGFFFAYGPQLLVRAPQQETRLPEVLMPWENPTHRQQRER